MTYDDVITDIRGLVGLKLNSIRPGAEITVVAVNSEDQRIELRDSSGRLKTRPLDEIRRIWESLCSGPAVHVDSVLGGSSSSRNQPETILANLPYIEWLMYEGRKHIAFVTSSTHRRGTTRRMDTVQEQMTVDEMRLKNRDDSSFPQALVVCTDPRAVAHDLEAVTGRQVKAIDQGVYLQPDSRILVVSDAVMPKKVLPGTYAVIEGLQVPGGAVEVRVAGYVVHVVTDGTLNLALMRKS